MKHGKISLVLGILLLLPLFTFAFVPNVAAYTITVDGDPSDWMADTSGQGENTRAYYTSYMPCGSEYVWKDEAGDDTGNGTYTYPTNTTAYPPGIVDILEFRVTSDLNNLYMLFKMGDVVNPAPSDVDGFKNIVIDIMIDTDNVPGSGEQWSAQDARVLVRGELEWEYQVVIKANATGWSSPWFGSFIANSSWYCFGHKSVTAKGSTVTDYIEVAVPLSFTDDDGQSYSIDIMDKELKFVVAVGFCDWCVGGYDGSPSSGNMLEVVNGTAGPLNPGGGDADWADPDVMDMCFYGSKAAQEADLNGFTVGNPMYVGGVSYCQGYEVIYFSSSTPPCPYAKVHLVDSTDWTDWNLTGDYVGGVFVGYGPGDTFTLDVIVENITDMYGWDIAAAWDPTVVNCTAFSEGTFLSSTGYPTIGIDGDIDNVLGKIEPPGWGRALKGAPKGQNGSSTDAGKGALASMDFILLSPLDYCTETWINLTITLWDSRMKPITVPINDAYWHYPKPPAGPPEAKFTESPPPYFANVTNISFDASSSVPGWNGTHNVPIKDYTWDWGDGSATETYAIPTATHMYKALGTFYPSLTITLDATFDPNYPTAWLTDTVNSTKLISGVPPGCYLDLVTEGERTQQEDPTPFIGTGPGFPADAYRPDEEVTLYAYLTYNGDPQQGYLINFTVRNAAGVKVLAEVASTNKSGIATISFRIPVVCPDPTEIFGKWTAAIMTAVCEVKQNDTLQFEVCYIVELLKVVPIREVEPGMWAPTDYFEKIPGDVGEHMGFQVWLQNWALHDKWVTIAVNVYDDNNDIIAHIQETLLLPAGDFCDPLTTVVIEKCLTIPQYAKPGPRSRVTVGAFYLCGQPFCDPVSTSFDIVLV